MSKVLNLDKMLPDPKKVILGGKEYTLSSSLKVKDTLNLLKTYGRFQDDVEDTAVMEGMLEQAASFFKENHPEMTSEKLGEMINVEQLPKLVLFLYESMTDAAEEIKSEGEKKTVKKLEETGLTE